MRAISESQISPNKSYFKAFRALCLLMKVTAVLHVDPVTRRQLFRQIKDKEQFEKWDRIQ